MFFSRRFEFVYRTLAGGMNFLNVGQRIEYLNMFYTQDTFSRPFVVHQNKVACYFKSADNDEQCCFIAFSQD